MINDFATVDGIKIKRGKHDLSHRHITSFNVGDLVPIMVKELIPGDYISLDINSVIRQSTLLKPVMDSLNVDIGVFWVPHLVTFPEFPKVLGANDDNWDENFEKISMPTIDSPPEGWKPNTIANRVGIPANKPVKKINSMRIKAVVKVYNDWYRDQNLEKSLHLDMTNTHKQGSNGDNYIVDAELGGKLLKANKYPDRFTTALPGSQKGKEITIPIAGFAEVVTKNQQHKTGESIMTGETNTPLPDSKNAYYLGGRKQVSTDNVDVIISPNSGGEASIINGFRPNNLYTDLSTALGVPISDIREFLSLQQLEELSARSGTRYPEIIESRFGIKSKDRDLQRSELLGGFHQPLQTQQVVQFSYDEQTPLGNLGAFSHTEAQSNRKINKFITEFGTIVVLACVRYKHVYQQGLPKEFRHLNDEDLYNSIFANISEQPIKNEEIYLSGDEKVDQEVFGFQEAWYEYRNELNRTSGIMNANAEQNIEFWHYGDDYDKTPVLSAEWIKENPENVDRSLAIKSDVTDQLICDFYFDFQTNRTVPKFSTPGLRRF